MTGFEKKTFNNWKTEIEAELVLSKSQSEGILNLSYMQAGLCSGQIMIQIKFNKIITHIEQNKFRIQ